MTVRRDADNSSVLSPVADLVELSIATETRQIDVSLPLDVPIADLIPELVRRQRPASDTETSAAEVTQQRVWLLERAGTGDRFALHETLRETGVCDGELLRLVTDHALSVPTLYDDVVDAAARLNRAGHPGWDRRAARLMAFAGVHLVSAVWVYFLLSETSAHHRTAFTVIATGVTVSLVGAAVLAHRGYQRSDIGTALGWASIPVAAALVWTSVWTVLPERGGYGPAAACLMMLAFTTVAHRVTGTGASGYRCAMVFFTLSAVAFTVHSAGVSAEVTAAGLVVTATLGCLAVPHLTDRTPRRSQESTDDTASGGPKSTVTETDLWERMCAATALRAGLYAGLALSAVAGVTAVLRSAAPPAWPDLLLAATSAALPALHGRYVSTAAERAVLWVSAGALVAVSCSQCRRADGSVPLEVFGVLLLAVWVFAALAVGAFTLCGSARARVAGEYLTYVTAAALIPLAWWSAADLGQLAVW